MLRARPTSYRPSMKEMPERIQLTCPTCAMCGAPLVGRRRKFCERHAKNSRRSPNNPRPKRPVDPEAVRRRLDNVRLAVQDYRRYKPDAPHIDRRADLWRRLRKGELLPLCIVHLPSGRFFAVSGRAGRVLTVPPDTFQPFVHPISLKPSRGTFAVITLPPWQAFTAELFCKVWTLKTIPEPANWEPHVPTLLVGLVPRTDLDIPRSCLQKKRKDKNYEEEARVTRWAFSARPSLTHLQQSERLRPDYLTLRCKSCLADGRFDVSIGIVETSTPLPEGYIQRVYFHDARGSYHSRGRVD